MEGELNDLAPEFVSLWTRYQPDVRRYVCMIVPLASDAEDVMQETAKRLWEKFEPVSYTHLTLPTILLV